MRWEIEQVSAEPGLKQELDEYSSVVQSIPAPPVDLDI
jgi:hypothetical protein